MSSGQRAFAGVLLALVVAAAVWLSIQRQAQPTWIQRAETDVGTLEGRADPVRADPRSAQSVAVDRQQVSTSADRLILDLLYGSLPVSRAASLQFVSLAATGALCGVDPTTSILVELQRDLAKESAPEFLRPVQTAEALRALWRDEVELTLPSWEAYLGVATDHPQHLELRRLLDHWPWTADDLAAIESIRQELLAIESPEELFGRCSQLLRGGPLGVEAVARAFAGWIAAYQSQQLDVVLAAYVSAGDPGRDLVRLSSCFAAEQTGLGQTDLDRGLMYSAQILGLMLSGKRLGVGTPSPAAGRADWIAGLLEAAPGAERSTGASLLFAIASAGVPGSPELVEIYRGLFEGSTHPLIRETLLVNLGRVASYEQMREVAGVEIVAAPEEGQVAEQLAYLTGLVNLRNARPEHSGPIAREFLIALEGWRHEPRLRRAYRQLLETLAFSPLPEVAARLRGYYESGGDPYPELLQRAYQACAESRN